MLSSAIGALYGVLQYILDLNGIVGVAICVFFAYLMCFLCYKDKKFKSLTLLSLLFLFVSATLGGLMSLIYSSLNTILHNMVVENGFDEEYKVARHMVILIFTVIISILLSVAIWLYVMETDETKIEKEYDNVVVNIINTNEKFESPDIFWKSEND